MTHGGASPSYDASVGALYVHVPFCARKCAYCDFVSDATDRNNPCMDAYLDERLHEIERSAGLGLLWGCKTAYVGGGTPTLLGAYRLGKLIRAIRDACPQLDELSCEANPDSLHDDVLAAMTEAGATRVSVGVQSLDDDELTALGRLHTAAQAAERVRAAVRAGLDVSVDLMCAIPRQTDSSWDKTLREVVGLGVGHVSVYPLVIEEGTAFHARYGSEMMPWNDEDVQAERMERAREVLEAAGLKRYEVASYARDGKRCRHNMAYWTGVEYLGLGRGAASMVGAATYSVVRELYGWLPEPPTKEREAGRGASRMRFSTLDRQVEFLDAREAWAEDLMLGMRLTQGVEAARMDEVPQVRDDLIARGLIRREGDRLAPTHDGWLLGNELFGALWELADERS